MTLHFLFNVLKLTNGEEVFKMKKLISLMMLCLFVFLSQVSPVEAANSYESGLYELENDVYHESEVGMASARTYLEPTMKVEIRKNSVTYYVSFVASEYMENYRMKLNGEEVPVEMTEDENSVIVKVETDGVDADMAAVIYVGPMERDVEFDVIPKLETMTLIEAIEEPAVNLSIVGAVGVIVVVAAVGVVFAVKRKNTKTE